MMIEKLKYLRKKCGERILYDDMMICCYCKYWGVVNWCNLKNKKTYYGSTCKNWEILE